MFFIYLTDGLSGLIFKQSRGLSILKKLIWCGDDDYFHNVHEATALAVVEKVKNAY